MEPIVTQPGLVTSQTVTVTNGTRWSSDMCDCCDDCGICCFAFWCLPCFQCSTASEFGECLCLPLMEIPTAAASLMGCVGCSGICPPITIAMRAAIRERHKIQGSICDDCVRSCCCYSCTWCQMAREIRRRGNYTITTAQTTVLSNLPTMPPGPGYTPLTEY